ncbi:MAG: alcohol dehydrogenase catalytic domain-containing protein [Actinomycetota bacterium]
MRDMRAFVVTGPFRSQVEDVPEPIPAAGQVVVDIERVGVCGTDVELYTGEMAYLTQGHAAYPLRPGHEWSGTVSAVGEGVDPDWVGRRTTGDTMLGCGQCRRCHGGRQNVCADRYEVGIRGGFAGALAERMAVPVSSLHPLPDNVDEAAGALVEPGGNSLRAVRAAQLEAGDRLLILGPGTIGLLAALFALAQGVEVHVLGLTEESLVFARSLGVHGAWPSDRLPALAFDAVIDASFSPDLPSLALELVEPGKRVVYVGLAGSPSPIDTRALVLKDVTAVGVLGASHGLDGTIERYAAGSVDPRPLVAATVGLDGVGDVLAGSRPSGAGPGPKIHVDPRR